MKVFAYRGESRSYPENTMLAFKKAIQSGADGIQLDVHFSRERYLVVFHDDSLSRVMDAVGFVRHHSISDLKNYNYKMQYEGPRQHIITLEEYLNWAKELPLQTVIHLKNDQFFYPGMEDQICQMISRFGLEDRVLLSSQRLDSLGLIRSYHPEMKIAWLAHSSSDSLLERVQALKPDWVIPHITLMHPGFVQKMREMGVKLMPYVIKSDVEAQRMESMGAEAILTDEVQPIRQSLGLKKNPYSESELERAKTAEDLIGDQDGEQPLTAKAKLKLAKRSSNLGSGLLGILLSMAISVGAAVLAGMLVFNLLKGFLK